LEESLQWLTSEVNCCLQVERLMDDFRKTAGKDPSSDVQAVKKLRDEVERARQHLRAVPPPGLKWECLDAPTAGREIKSQALQQLLREKSEITREELSKMKDLRGLTYDDCIKVDGSYFKPVPIQKDSIKINNFFDGKPLLERMKPERHCPWIPFKPAFQRKAEARAAEAGQKLSTATDASVRVARDPRRLRVMGSLLLPTKQLLMQKSSRSWEGTFLSEAYLSCTEQAEAISKEILAIYARYGVELLVEAPGVQTLEDIALVQSLLAAVPARQPRIHERAAAAATPVSPTGPAAPEAAPGARLPTVATWDSVVQSGPNSAAASTASLAGGYKVGDRVRALVGDAYAKVSAGDEGTVVGQCNSKCTDKAERVLVDFKRDRNFWDFIVQHSHVKQYSDGEVIADEGEVQVSLYFVKSGTVQEVVGIGAMRTLQCPSHWGPDSLQTALDDSQLLPARMVAQGIVEVNIIPVKELFRRDRLPLQACEKFFQDLQSCQRVNFRAEDEIGSCEIKGERVSRTAPQTIFVTETRTGKSMALEVEARDTVYMVKCAIQEIDGTLPERQELMYAGKLLEDSRSLGSYKIMKHAKLHWGLYRADVKEDIQRQRQHHLDLVTRPDFFFKSIRMDITLHEVIHAGF
jgi:large subunit ribosomal protein L40e